MINLNFKEFLLETIRGESIRTIIAGALMRDPVELRDFYKFNRLEKETLVKFLKEKPVLADVGCSPQQIADAIKLLEMGHGTEDQEKAEAVNVRMLITMLGGSKL